jgi:hypothetical protein
MVLYIDLDLGRFVGAPGFGTAPRPIEHKRGDGGDVSIQFCRGTTLESLEAGSSIIYQAKLAGKYDADPLVECANFTDPAVAGGPHTGPLTFDVTALGTALAVDADEDNDVAALDVMYEVSWKLPGKGWASTDTLAGKINNDVIRSDQGLLPAIDGEVPGTAASVTLTFDNAIGDAIDITAGSFTVGDWSVNLWDGSTGSAPAEPYIQYTSGATIIQTWIVMISEALNTGAVTAGGTLVGTLAAHNSVTATGGVLGQPTIDWTLTADEVGTQGNSIAYAFATTPSEQDKSGNLAGGIDSRNFAQDDFVSTLADTLTTGQKAQAIANLIEAGSLNAGAADLETEGSGHGLILESPDGSRWRVTVDNYGVLSTASI